MKIDSLYTLFNTPARQKALQNLVADNRTKTIHITGLQGSAASLLLSSLSTCGRPVVLVANDMEEAGYLYHDLVQIQGEGNIVFFLPAINVPLNTDKWMRQTKYYGQKLLIV